MSKNYKANYLAPEVEVMEMVVEQGFSVSDLESLDDEKDEIKW